MFAFTLTLTLTGGCGTVGSYEVPASARRAAAMDRTLDRWLAGVELGTERPAARAVVPALVCSTAGRGAAAPERRLAEAVEAGRGLVGDGAPLRLALRRDRAAGPRAIRLRVTPATTSVALQGLVAIVEQGGSDPAAAAARAAAAAAVARHLAAAGQLTGDGRAWLGARACEAAETLIGSQRPDGAWAGEAGDAAVTAQALDALIALRGLGVEVPPHAVEAASDALAAAVGDDGVVAAGAVPSTGLSPREVEAARLAVGAQAFAALEAADPEALGERARAALPRLEARFAALVAEPTLEVPTLAWAVAGLARARGPGPIDRADLWRAARRLWQRRHELHDWAPRWSRAYGGAEEVTARSLEALGALDPEWLEAARPEALRATLWAREPTGRWRDPRATAAAVRTLLLVDPDHPGARGAATVVAACGGRELRRVEVDLRDPLAAARALMAIDLGAADAAGPGELEIRLEGARGVTALAVVELVGP